MRTTPKFDDRQGSYTASKLATETGYGASWCRRVARRLVEKGLLVRPSIQGAPSDGGSEAERVLDEEQAAEFFRRQGWRVWTPKGELRYRGSLDCGRCPRCGFPEG